MSSAPRDTKCLSASTWRLGQASFGQRCLASPSARTTGVPHSGHRSGIEKTCSAPVLASRTGPTTCGITSPARWTITVSPTRMSLRRMSSSLWSVASLTVTPPTSTGSSSANGLRAPVRPTLIPIERSLVVRGWWELVGHRPPRVPADGAERGLHGEGVHLDDDAVDLVRQLAPAILRLLAGLDDLVEGVVQPRQGVDGKAERGDPGEGLVVASELDARALDLADRVAPERERPLGRLAGVLLAERAGRRVPGVHEHGLAEREALVVHPLERVAGHVDLAPHLEERRRGAREPQRELADRPQIGGDVLADLAVAPGRAAGEDAVLVAQGDRQAVDLRLRHEGDLGGVGAHVRDPPQEAVPPGEELVPAPGVGEGQHRPAVTHGGEVGDRRPAHPPGRRLVGDELGMRRLQRLQLPEEPVVGGVVDERLVERVVGVVEALDLRAQLVDAAGRVVGHAAAWPRRSRRTARQASPSSSASSQRASGRSASSSVRSPAPQETAIAPVPAARAATRSTVASPT